MSITLFKVAHICQWFERMNLRGFVTLCVQMCVAVANKVEDTMS